MLGRQPTMRASNTTQLRDVRSERFAVLGRRSQLTALGKRPDHRPLVLR